ncbi:hypothetical protein IWZ03DRAFT_374613 [Phyllosticta citriasiana]|uniref:Ribosomal protein/NADH dehydrogenase domain-containing protein n=1 Tax=Phyllosticta citriasiana TaxID=595635 RepID=A0ABR1KSD3_9PEZI
MPTIQQRMFKLKEQLLWIRIGPGSATIPRNVASIRLRMAKSIDGGNRGPKKFLREIVPRIKYRNPWLPIKVNRGAEPHEGAFLTVNYAPEAKRAPTRIEMKYKAEGEIWSQLADAVHATEIKPTDVELEETEEIRKKNEHSKVVREAQLQVNARLKREKQLLEAAKQQTTAALQSEQGA